MKRQRQPKPAVVRQPTSDNESARARWSRITSVPADEPSPSLVLASAHNVEDVPRPKRERERSTHALDFDGVASNSLTFVAATAFPGFPTLSLLGQLAEYRSMHETLADECVRKWGKVASAGKSDPERLSQIESELRRLDLRAVVRQAVIHDQAFGRAHVFFKMRGDEGVRELPLVPKPYTVPVGSFEAVRVIEPYWVTPNFYNSSDPTAADFYKPSTWWALAIETHATRLYTLVGRPVADMLKPAYSFAGVSMTQLAMPYVDNWLRTRQSVSDAVKQFAVSGVLADLQQALLPGGAADLQARAQLINAYRDNRNLLFLDKATEEFFSVATPLAGLHELQAQAQEQMAAVSHIPLTKLLGITPTGLNASSEGEIRTFYDYVRGYQSNVLLPFMLNVLQFAQLSLFGEIDEGVTWEWHPMHELTSLEEAEKRWKDAESDVRYMETGVLTPEHVAQRLNADPGGLYSGLLNDMTPVDDLSDNDIEGITERILKIGTNDDPASQPGQEGQNPAGHLAGQPGGVQPAAAQGPGEHEGELHPLGEAQVQGRPDREPVVR